MTCDQLVITNPKRRSATHAGRDQWFPYYAGFSSDFARQLIASGALAEGSTLMDPWNGSGTTTSSAALNGCKALGFDLNPVMAVVAKAMQVKAPRSGGDKTRSISSCTRVSRRRVLYSQSWILLFSIRLISNSMFNEPDVPDTVLTPFKYFLSLLAWAMTREDTLLTRSPCPFSTRSGSMF